MDINMNIMKKVLVAFPTWLVKLFGGTDKLLHGLVAAYIIMLFEPFGVAWAALGFLLAIVVCVLREWWSDSPDWKDVDAALVVGLVELLRFALFMFFANHVLGMELQFVAQ